MKKNILLLMLTFGLWSIAQAQNVAINTDGTTAHNSAALDIKSTSRGLLIPRMNTTQRTAISSPARGLLVFDTTTNSFWFFGKSAWNTLSAANTLWSITGNAGTDTAVHFIGTTDDKPLLFRVNNEKAGSIDRYRSSVSLGHKALSVNTTGTNNLAAGSSALMSNTIGYQNVALGTAALSANVNGVNNTAVGAFALESNKNSENTAVGFASLGANTIGTENTATGNGSLKVNTTGYSNTATGSRSLLFNSSGYFNTAMGGSAAYNNETGHDLTAIGYKALYNNKNSFNTAVGAFSLLQNTFGEGNTAIGYKALEANQSGTSNTAAGLGSLQGNTTGSYNTSHGYAALAGNKAGVNNTAAGYRALLNSNANNNTAFGYSALISNQTGNENIAIGVYALSSNISGQGNTAVGNYSGELIPNNAFNVTLLGYQTGWGTTGSNQINIGNFAVSWIGGQVPWGTYSDARIKRDIQENVPGLSFITKLKPVTYFLDIRQQEQLANGGYNWRTKTANGNLKNASVSPDWEGKYDIEKIRMTGFLAQDVERAAAEAGYNFSGVIKPKDGNGLYSLQYSSFVVPLVKALQEQQAIIEAQQKRIERLERIVLLLDKQSSADTVDK